MKIDRTPPTYLREEDVDVLARQNAQLMAELWIVKDRLALLENMLSEAGLLKRSALDDSVPEGALADELSSERQAYIRRIMGDTPDERSVDSLKARAANTL